MALLHNYSSENAPCKDGKLSQLWRKEGHTNVQRSAELGFEPGTLWLEGRVLTTAPTTPHLKTRI